MLRMTVLYFPLLFLFLPFWHREGFSAQQCELQWPQAEKHVGDGHGNMQKHMGVEAHSVEVPYEMVVTWVGQERKENFLTWGEKSQYGQAASVLNSISAALTEST